MEITSDWIDRYNDKELNEVEQALFRKRLEENPLLRTEVDIDKSLNRLFQDNGTLDLMRKLELASERHSRENGNSSYLLIAASILCLIALGAILNLMYINTENISFNRDRSDIESSQKSKERIFTINFLKVSGEVKKITPVTRREMSRKQHLAMVYKPLAEFESLVGVVTRSAQLRIVQPNANLVIPLGKEVWFSWVNPGKGHHISIILYDNQGKLVFDMQDLRGESYKMSTKDLFKGLYYWKVIKEDEMVFMGKIKVL